MSEQHQKPVIGITLGDYNGIGPEVILKALHGNHLNKQITPVIYGSMRVLNRYKHLYDMKDWQLHGIASVSAVNHKLVNVITCFDDSQTSVEPGKVSPEAGQAAFECLQQAVSDLKEGHIAALITGPINKHTIQSESFKFPGHTEFLAERFESTEYLMFMVSERLKIGVVTGHVPLGRVRSGIHQDAVSRKLTQIVKSLQEDFGITKPRIAVLGLNPHAGEDGLLGNEEKDVIAPVIEQFRKKNHLIYGPFPADGFFGAGSWKKFDAVLAMYHDQGLMPFKMLAFEDGVNFTAGLPAVRTSPDHGTAYDIAGKNLADPGSMLQAIFTALDVVRNREEWEDLKANRLEKTTDKPAREDKQGRRDDRPRDERPRDERPRDDRPREPRPERTPREERGSEQRAAEPVVKTEISEEVTETLFDLEAGVETAGIPSAEGEAPVAPEQPQPERQPRGERPPRRDDRGPRGQQQERGPKEERGPRNQQERPPREERQPREDRGPKEERQPREDRGPKNQQDRPPREERGPREEGAQRDNQPRREKQRPNRNEPRPVPPLSPDLVDLREAQRGLMGISEEKNTESPASKPDDPAQE